VLYTVYILFSAGHNKIYIGYTSNLIFRFYSHNNLSTKDWTKNFRPWLVIYCEYYHDKKEAKKGEKQLKGAKGREWIYLVHVVVFSLADKIVNKNRHIMIKLPNDRKCSKLAVHPKNWQSNNPQIISTGIFHLVLIILHRESRNRCPVWVLYFIKRAG
jgi:putative endonuclease